MKINITTRYLGILSIIFFQNCTSTNSFFTKETWLLQDLNAKNYVLLITPFETLEKKPIQVKDFLSKKYSYPYIFIKTSDTSLYTDKEKYRYVLVAKNGINHSNTNISLDNTPINTSSQDQNIYIKKNTYEYFEVFDRITNISYNYPKRYIDPLNTFTNFKNIILEIAK